MKIRRTKRIFTEDGEKLIEFRFLRGEILLWNCFYNIDDLNKNDLKELELECSTKFFAAFEQLSPKMVLKGNTNKLIDLILKKVF